MNKKSVGRPSRAKQPPHRGRAKAAPRAKPPSKPPAKPKVKSAIGARPDAEAGSKSGHSKSAHSKSAHSKPRKTAGGKRTQSVSTGKAAAVDPALRRAKTTIRNLKAELVEARARIDELQAWADTDFLLDVFNRRGFERELARSLAYIRRYDARGALVVLDVDGLKPINDTFGHAAGDAVLKGIVAVLMRHVRSSDVVGRLGGDEFGVLLWNLDEANALAKAAALESAIDHLTFVFRGRSIVAGASAGIAMLDVDSDPAAILEAADRAMYARKLLRKDATAAGLLKR